jgi:heme-degrading monooxygenase HmoA
MPHRLIHHKVREFAIWNAGYDDHKPVRDHAGLKELHLLQGSEDPNEVVILFEADDLAKVCAFIASDDLKKTMARAGVVGAPAIIELQ